MSLTPGTGSFHCGACIRDNALVTALRARGHDALLVPLYLPFLVDEEDASAGTPILLGGVNMYLQQVSRLFRRTPRWLDRLFDWRPVLRLAARRAAMTKPDSLGEMTLSTLAGESGRQKKEVRRLVAFLEEQGRPDVVALSNVLLVGLVRGIREGLGPVKVVAALQGEDAFLDSLPEPHRAAAWDLVRERCRDLDAVLPVSRTYGERMAGRLGLDPGMVRPVHPGIRVEGHEPASAPPRPPAIGFLARMTPAKGLDALVDAFLALRRGGLVPDVRLRIAGSMTAADRPFVRGLRGRIRAAGLEPHVDWLPDLTREGKLAFLRSLTVLSVPANSAEAFGLYAIEALASGVPLVLPRHGAFPEVIAETGGGALCEPDDPEALAQALADLLRDPERARSLGARGREAVLARFTAGRMAEETLAALEEVTGGPPRLIGGSGAGTLGAPGGVARGGPS